MADSDTEDSDCESAVKKKNSRNNTVKRLSADNGFYIHRIDQLDEKIGNISICLDHFKNNSMSYDLIVDKHQHNNLRVKNIHNKAFEKSTAIDFKDGLAAKKSLGGMSSNFEDSNTVTSSCRSFRKRPQTMLGMSESSQHLSKRPALVELQSFPGYDKDEITPLPCSFEAIDILKIVTAAQKDLKRKPTFKRDFKRFYYSRLSQAMLKDTFWWYFCEKYQPLPMCQEKLYNRISQNFTKLLIKWIGAKYEDTIFLRYPDLLAQSVYATLCQAFPTSYRQFDDKFKDDLILVVHLWITGTQPPPRTFEKWNFEGLEPADMRKGEKLHLNGTTKSKKNSVEIILSDESLDLLKRSSSQKISLASHATHVPSARRMSKVAGKNTVKRRTGSFLLPTLHDPATKDMTSASRDKPSNRATSPAPSFLKNVSMLNANSDSRQVKDGVSALQMPPAITRVPAARKKKLESCKAGKGPGFSKNVFDVYGRSPLIEQHLRSNHLSKDAGMAILIRRTEIESLPPYPFHFLQFLSHQKGLDDLLSNPKEVKRISDMICLQIMGDQDDDNDKWMKELAAELRKALGNDVVE
eukprot:Seg2203.3 transcript_id=Seg2203.3/GoldUCD/mRNA.D3Y31 product="Protein FAM227A" protein_id=Seg2203.3/GoldUCD/D3Y31